jgi:ApaG protein
MHNNTTSDTLTQGIRVQVFPVYMTELSRPEENEFMFSYRVLITNEGDRWVKLLGRRWIIINADGDRQEVEGPGVVGYIPEFNPGESFEYSSSCPIDTSWGTMEGYYTFMYDDGNKFNAEIGRFYLVSAEVTA